MSETLELEIEVSPATDGDIAVINLRSTREGAWSRFWRTPDRPGLAEYIVEHEGLALTFLGDCCALDRMTTLLALNNSPVWMRAQSEPSSFRRRLPPRRIASPMPGAISCRPGCLALAATVDRLSLGIDQACGTRPDTVLSAARRRIAAETRHLVDLVPLGGLLADLGQFDESDQVYRDALRNYQDVSPFAFAWVCFQLGVLWGELVPERQSARAALWYGKALAYLPAYVKARVPLAEIYLDHGRHSDAEALLTPVISSGDPEVPWRCLATESAPHRRQARGRSEAAGVCAGRLREPLGQAPARLRGPRRSVLCRQRQRSQTGPRTRPYQPGQSADTAGCRAGAHSRDWRPRPTSRIGNPGSE